MNNPTFNQYLDTHVLFREVDHVARDLRLTDAPAGSLTPTTSPSYTRRLLNVQIVQNGASRDIELAPDESVHDWLHYIAAALAAANRPTDSHAIEHIIDTVAREREVLRALNAAMRRPSANRDDLRAHPLYNPDAHIIRLIPALHQNAEGVIYTTRQSDTPHGIVLAILTDVAWSVIKRGFNVTYGVPL